MQQEIIGTINPLKDYGNLSDMLQNDKSGAEVRKLISYFDALAKQTEIDRLRSDDAEFRRIANFQYEALQAASRMVTDIWEQLHSEKLN
jgi:hypothetical protein